MAKIVLILGRSGTGKSASLRNVEEFDYINVSNKPLPFRKQKEQTIHELASQSKREIMNKIKNSKTNIVVIDDCQYLMGFNFMRRVSEKGWEKFNEIQGDYFEVLNYALELDDPNKIIYFMSHVDEAEDGKTKIKTIGKMLDEKICLEGMFTIVLNTLVSDGNYYFTTQNSGMNTAKSPMGMFKNYTIGNDLNFVNEAIKNYYYLDGAKTDENIAQEGEKVKGDVIAPNEDKTRRKRNKKESEASEEVETEKPKTRKRRTKASEEAEVEKVETETPITEETTPPKRKRRTKAEMEKLKEKDTIEKITDDIGEAMDEACEEKPMTEEAEVVEEVKTRRRRKVEKDGK